MDEQTVTLNNDGGENAQRDESDLHVRAVERAGAMKFTYASGSRPLDGYSIKRGIGIGGFGEVYFAISDAGKEVALKHIQRNLDVELRGVTQCLNLKHPNLVSLFDIRYDDHGGGWVVMEYISGIALKDVIDAHPQGMPLPMVRSWLMGIASGTAYLHDHGIVHRDLKPGNLFLDEDIVKIGDYGLSKFISVSRRSGQTESVGTFHYMAPEIGKGIYGREIDVYALGVILYEMLTGNVPFDGESSQEIIMKHLTDEPDLSPLPPPYDRVVARALTKDPENRYSNVTEIVAQLDLDGKGSGGASTRTSTHVRDPVQKNEEQGLLYIGDEDDERDIVFGPVEEVVHPDVSQDFDRRRATSNRSSNSREPIAQSVRCGWQRTHNWWASGSPVTPLKVLILILVALFLLGIAGWLLPATLLAILAYLGYLGVRALVLEHPGTPPPVATAISLATEQSSGVTSRGRRRSRRAWQDRGRETIREKSTPRQITEVMSSMITSAVVLPVLGIVVMILGGKLSGDMIAWAPTYAWLTLSSIAAAWTLIVGTKRWEGYQGDAALRRVGLLLMGLVVGITSFGVSKMLLIEPQELWFAGHPNSLVERYPEQFYSSADGAPQLLAFLSYFAGLFVVLRLWKQTDPLRRSRLSLFGTGVCVLWALALHSFVPLPHGVMLAGMTSIAVQLAAPWIDGAERLRIRQEAQNDYV